jgi:DNA-binding transcriptional LysR family regulator
LILVRTLVSWYDVHLETLKLFCDVVRLGSMSRAAVANYRTQSAASQAVAQLEKRLGVRLLDRSARPLRLTDHGRRYYEGCRELIEKYLELENALRQGPAFLQPTVQVAAIYSVGLGDMGLYVDRFRREQPHARVQVDYLHPDRVYERILEATADLGLVSFPRRSRELAVIPWRQEEMVLACPVGHRLARRRSVRPAQLRGEPFVGFDRNLVIRREVDRFLRDGGVDVAVAMEFDNIENIKKAVEVGAGVALLPEPTLRREVGAGTLAALPLAGTRLVRPLGIIHRRNHPFTTAAGAFLRLLQESPDAPAPQPRPARKIG